MLRQRRTLAELGPAADKVTWEETSEPAEASVEGCILSNELVDSFPHIFHFYFDIESKKQFTLRCQRYHWRHSHRPDL